MSFFTSMVKLILTKRTNLQHIIKELREVPNTKRTSGTGFAGSPPAAIYAIEESHFVLTCSLNNVKTKPSPLKVLV